MAGGQEPTAGTSTRVDELLIGEPSLHSRLDGRYQSGYEPGTARISVADECERGRERGPLEQVHPQLTPGDFLIDDRISRDRVALSTEEERLSNWDRLLSELRWEVP